MNRIVTAASAIVAAIAVSAQTNVAVTYRVTNCDTDSGDPYSSEMTLVAGQGKSLYYNKMSLYVDSCNSTPEGKARLREVQLKAWRVEQPDGTVTYDGRKLGLAPEKSEYLYVAKNRDEGMLCVYDYYAGGLARYTEADGDMQWTVVPDSARTILGHECLMARTAYHGRDWTVWFTPEIPVQDGPWKLHGLPGLILAAQGGDGFVIEAEEAGMTPLPVPEVYSVSEYSMGERRKLLADREHYQNNLESILAAQGIKLNGDGTSAGLPKYDRRKRAWETDY